MQDCCKNSTDGPQRKSLKLVQVLAAPWFYLLTNRSSPRGCFYRCLFFCCCFLLGSNPWGRGFVGKKKKKKTWYERCLCSWRALLCSGVMYVHIFNETTVPWLFLFISSYYTEVAGGYISGDEKVSKDRGWCHDGRVAFKPPNRGCVWVLEGLYFWGKASISPF